MTKNNGTIKRVTRKRSSAPKTVRKPRLAAEAIEELAAGAAIAEVEVEASAILEETPIVAAAPEPAPLVEHEIVFDLEVVPPEPQPEPAPVTPPRAVSVLPEMRQPDRTFRRVAFVRAMMHRLRRAAEKRAAPIARRLEARFPRLLPLRETLQRWF